ncbi:MAG: ATP-binding protein [Candidatus Aminicenantes bacterium]|nr:MAG: ATP-binding protein [Candidatus Aminicenantes bacterium]
MRISTIRVNDVPPVKCFNISGLSNVVVIAGRNGVGKTRLLQQLVNYCQNPTNNQNIQLVLDATCETEVEAWGKPQIDTTNGQDATLLQNMLQANRLRRNWKSSVVNIESDRSIRKIDPYRFSFDVVDPDEESVSWNFTFGGFQNRYQDTIHAIFRKVHAHRNKISSKAERLMRQGKKRMQLDFPDPLEPFKNAFRQLVAPKELLDADLKAQQLKYALEGQELLLTTLSSGESEVTNIVFDFILRNPSDCVVIFDEPELHLHPELSYKLIQTLTGIGENNQFIFCTHSPDIITASLEHSVVFIGPPLSEGQNQAIPVSEDDETNQALKLLGQSVGIIALGKKIVLIEGTHASLDKLTYGAIFKESFPDLVLVPSSGKCLIRSFSTLVEEVLDKSIWGVEFFMLCDGDTIPLSLDKSALTKLSKGRLSVLERYHLENYFLEEDILAKVFSSLEPEGSWLRTPDSIRKVLKDIAKDMTSYTVSLYTSAHFREEVGNIDLMPRDCNGKSAEHLKSIICSKATTEETRINQTIDSKNIAKFIDDMMKRMEDSIEKDTDDWKKLIPGKSILNIFSSKAGMQVGMLKRAYIAEAMKSDPNPFNEIIQIFERFNK